MINVKHIVTLLAEIADRLEDGGVSPTGPYQQMSVVISLDAAKLTLRFVAHPAAVRERASRLVKQAARANRIAKPTIIPRPRRVPKRARFNANLATQFIKDKELENLAAYIEVQSPSPEQLNALWVEHGN